MKNIGLFPGTFDPITLGHIDLIKRALPLVDKLYIGIGINTQKKTMFSLEQRLSWIRQLFSDESGVEVVTYEGLTVDFCKKIQAGVIIRGIRSVKDFEYEKAIADMNSKLSAGVETLVLFSSPAYSTLASTLVRDVIRYGGDISEFLPALIVADLYKEKVIET